MTYQNLRFIADTHRQWEVTERFLERLPVNPAGCYLAEGDVEMVQIDVLNWTDEDGQFEFRPRLRDNVQWLHRIRLATDDEAPELDDDYEYDCD